MAAPQQPGVALTLERCATDLFAITVGLAPPPGGWDAAEASSAGDEEAQPLLPPPLPPRCAALNRSLAALRALATPALPFAAHPLGQDQLRVVTPRAHTAAVFKLLRAQQGALGIVVGDLKSCVAKPPLPRDELEAAAAAAVLAGLLHRGWHQLDEDRVLGASVLAPAADAAPQVCGSLTLRVRAEGDGTSTLRLLVRAGGTQGARWAGARWLGLWALGR